MTSNTIKLFILTFILAVSVPVQAKVLKIATLAPDGTDWMNQMRQASKRIAEQTNNRVKFKFYPGGIMGNEKSVLRKMHIGQLHGSAMTNTALSKLGNVNLVYSMPLKYRSYEEVTHIREKLDELLLKELYQNGYTAYSIAGDGFAYLLSQNPLKTLEDLKQQKVWVPKGDVVARTMLEELGNSPVSLPLTDVLTGLQTGLFTTVGAPPSFSIALQWHTKVKYLVDLPMFFSYGALVFSNKALKGISAQDQAILRKEITQVFKVLNKRNWENNLKAREALKSQGIEFIKPSKTELDKIYRLADQVTAKLIKEGVFDAGMVKQVNTMLAAYRKGK